VQGKVFWNPLLLNKLEEAFVFCTIGFYKSVDGVFPEIMIFSTDVHCKKES